MDAVLTSLAPAAAAAPARGIGSAVRSCGVAESEAAAGFAGILAAVPGTHALPAPVAAAPGKQIAGPDAALAAAAPDQPVAAMAPTTAPSSALETPAPAAPASDPLPPATAAAAAADAPGAVATPPAGLAIPDAADPAPATAPVAAANPGVTTPASAPAVVATAAQAPVAASVPAAVAAPAAATTLPAGPVPAEPAAADATPAPVPAETASPATAQVVAPTPANAAAAPAAAPVTAATTPAAADPEVPASAAAPLSVAAALDAASPAVALAAAEVEVDAAVATDKPAAARDTAQAAGDDEAPDTAATVTDTEPAPQGPTAAEQALLGVGLHTYLKAAGLPAARAAAVETPQSPATGDAAVAAGRPTAFAGLVNDLLAADAAVTTGNGVGVRLAGDLSDPATVANLRAQGSGASAASIRSQVAEQISRGLQAGKGEETLTIRLNPEELGQVDVDLRAVNDRLTITLRAGTPEAEQALRSGARELTDSIIERSGRFQHVEVRVESRDGGTLRAERPDDRNQDQKQDGKQQDGRRDGRGEARGHRTDDADSAREAWVRAFTDLSQPSQEA